MNHPLNLQTRIKRHYRNRKLQSQLWGYFFLLPEMIVILLFALYPILQGLSLSFFEYNVAGSTWVGAQNFIAMWKDDVFWIALRNTTLYTILTVPGGLVVALILSWIIFPLSPRTQSFFKAAYYLPSVLAGVVLALVWKWILDPDFGLINYLLSFIHLGPYPWLSHPDTALVSLALMSILGGQGASIIIILANMGAIPESLYESARIDGGNPWHLFRFITIPMLKPTILYLLVIGVISSYQVFDTIYIMTSGGPYYATTTIAYLIYSSAFDQFEFGKASAMATVLFIIIFILSMIQFYFFREDKK